MKKLLLTTCFILLFATTYSQEHPFFYDNYKTPLKMDVAYSPVG